MEGVDDPLLKELLATFRGDLQRVSEDILQGVVMQALIAAFGLILGVSSIASLLFFTLGLGLRGFRPPRAVPPTAGLDIALSIVLFILSVISLWSYLTLRRRYSRILSLAGKVGG